MKAFIVVFAILLVAAFAPSEAQVACGGQVTLSGFAVSSATPLATAVTATVSFATVGNLANGDKVILNFPSGYFTGTPTAALTGFTGTIGTTASTSVVITTNAPVNAGSFTVTIAGLILGGPMQATSLCSGFTVSTATAANSVVDTASSSALAPALGGSISTLAFTPASLVPATTATSVVIGFKTATTLAVSDTLVLTYPSGFLAANVQPTTPAAAATGSFAHSVGQTGLTSVTVTVATTAVVPGTYTITLAGLTMGPAPLAAVTNGITLSSSTDTAATANAPALGSQVTLASVTPSSTTPLLGSSSLVVVFTTATKILSSGSLTLNYPSSYVTGNTPTLTKVSTGFAASIAAAGLTSIIMTPSAIINPNTYTITIEGLTLGVIMAAPCQYFSVSTTSDLRSVGAITGGAMGKTTTVTSFTTSTSVPLTASSSVVVTFSTSTNIVSGGFVTLFYPNLYITGTPTTPVVASSGFAASIPILGTSSVVMTTTAAVTAGTFTVTIAGVTMGGPTQISQSNACSSNVGVSISTSTDRAGALFTPPNLGGLVSVTSFTPSIRTPLATSASLTVAFTTQTNIASGGFVTLFLPSGFVSGAATTQVTASTGFAASIGAWQPQGPSYTIGVMTTTAAVVAGSFTVTIAGVTLGAPMQLGTTLNVGMQTSTDIAKENGGFSASGSLGGVVSSPMVTIATADRIASVANRKVIVSFGIATNLASGDTISVGYPAGFLASAITGTLNGVTSGLAITLLATSSTSITLTTTAAVNSGSYSVTICGLTIGLGVAAQISSSGIKISTSKDSPSCVANVAVPTTMGQVSLVGLSIPWASRVAGTSGVNPVLTFTTATTVPASSCTANAVTVTITTTGTAFFSQTSSSCNILTPLSATGFTTVTIAQTTATVTTLTLSTNAPLAAGLYTVTLVGLTFGSSAGLDNGLSVATTKDTFGTGATGPLGGYRVDKVTVSSGCVSGSCGNVQVQFTSNVAIASPLVITFSSGALIDADSPAFMLGGALATPNVNVVSGAVTLTLTGMSAVPAGQYTVTLVGRIQPKAAGFVSVQTSTLLYSQSYAGTSTSVTTNSLSITGALPSNPAASGSIVFTTNSPVPIAGLIYITFKTGLFVVPPAVFSSTGCSFTQGNIATSFTSAFACVTFTASAPVADSPSAGLTTISLTNNGVVALPAGVNTVSFSGGKLGAAQSSTNTFSVTTSAEICSAGSIASGSISNTNPGGSAAAGASLLLSAAAALTCMLLLLL